MQPSAVRLFSIDTLRALTMLLMIFVNDVSDVKGLSAWIDHAGAGEDALGFADIIFPAFLFIVGLSLPLAINNRIRKGDSTTQLLWYILTRSVAMLIMGFYQVNLESYSHAALLPKAVWALIITLAFFLIWLDYPKTWSGKLKNLLRTIGVLFLVIMALLYKGGDGALPHGMRTAWWGILGIIGWAYLVCAVLYILFQRDLKLLLIAYVAFAAFNILCHTVFLQAELWLIGNASSVTLVMGGMVISKFVAHLTDTGRNAGMWLLLTLAGAGLIGAGLLIRPYAGGISKIQGTPAWVFISSGITILVFTTMIFFIDVKGHRQVFKWIGPAGTSTLTCYLLPYFQVFLLLLFQISYPDFFTYGLGGLLRSVFIAWIIIKIAGWLEKRHLRLRI